MLELGWDQEFYPSSYDPRWRSLLHQPRELTPRSNHSCFYAEILRFTRTYFLVWKVIQPKLIAALERNKREVLVQRRVQRLQHRRNEFRPIWTAYLEAREEADRRTMPVFWSAILLPSIANMLSENEATIPVTSERWESIRDEVSADVEKFRLRTQKALVKLLRSPSNEAEDDGCDCGEPEPEDFNILSRAAALFRCTSWPCEEILFYPSILRHEHVLTGNPNSDTPFFNISASASASAARLLELLGLPEDTSRRDMIAMHYRFVCTCEHPAVTWADGTPRGMTFLDLVSDDFSRQAFPT